MLRGLAQVHGPTLLGITRGRRAPAVRSEVPACALTAGRRGTCGHGVEPWGPAPNKPGEGHSGRRQ